MPIKEECPTLILQTLKLKLEQRVMVLETSKHLMPPRSHKEVNMKINIYQEILNEIGVLEDDFTTEF